MSKKVIVVGGGFAGMGAAALMAHNGYDVTLLEKNTTLGGRASVIERKGYRFDIGPSWYMMPDVIDFFFEQVNRRSKDYYNITKLDPSYKVYFEDETSILVRSDVDYMIDQFEKLEKGAGAAFQKYIESSKSKYNFSVPKYIGRSYSSLFDIVGWDSLRMFFYLELERSFHGSVSKQFKSKKIRKILEFMVVFLGGTPKNLPAFYNLINWADFGLGIYYPDGGFSYVVKGFQRLLDELGVKVICNSEVNKLSIKDKKVHEVITKSNTYPSDIVICGADYHFFETKVLESKYRSISEKQWDKMELAPSSFCIFLGIKKKISNLEHHTMFFNGGWDGHFSSIENVVYPDKPQYYVCKPTHTDSSVAPDGCENLFILVPLASGVEDSKSKREELFNFVISDMEKKLSTSIRKYIDVKVFYSVDNFRKDYNAFKGNAFGLAHTLRQSLFFRPKNWSQKVGGLYYVGQYTNPGTGTALAVFSSIIVRNLIKKHGF